MLINVAHASACDELQKGKKREITASVVVENEISDQPQKNYISKNEQKSRKSQSTAADILAQHDGKRPATMLWNREMLPAN